MTRPTSFGWPPLRHVAELGVVAIAESAQIGSPCSAPTWWSLPDDPALLVVGHADAIGDRRGPVALDLGSVISAALDGLRQRGDRSATPLVLLPGMLGSARVFADVVAQLGDDVHCRPLRIDLDDSRRRGCRERAGRSATAVRPCRTLAWRDRRPGGVAASPATDHRSRPAQLQRPTAVTGAAGGVGGAAPAHGTWGVHRSRRRAGSSQRRRPAGRVDLAQRWIEIAGDVGAEGFLRQLAIQSSRSDARRVSRDDRCADPRADRVGRHRVPAGDPGRARRGDSRALCT